MKRNQAKEIYPILQAFIDGKELEVYSPSEDTWVDVINKDEIYLGNNYRIKPEPKYRPFKDAEECWKEMKKHEPFGWVKDKVSKAFYHIGSFDVANIYVGTTNIIHSYADSLMNFTFVDGAPFGIKVEE